VSVVLRIIAPAHLAVEHGHSGVRSIAKNRTTSSILPRISYLLAPERLNAIEERIGPVGASTLATIHAHRRLRWRGRGNPAICIGPKTRGGGNSGVRMRGKSRTIPQRSTDSSIDRGCNLRIGIPAGHRVSRTMAFASSRSSTTLMVNRCRSKN